MKYLVALIVCALLTVSLIVALETVNVETPPELAVSLLVAIMTLPVLLLVTTIWALIGFTKTVNRWAANDPNFKESFVKGAAMGVDYQHRPSEEAHQELEEMLCEKRVDTFLRKQKKAEWECNACGTRHSGDVIPHRHKVDSWSDAVCVLCPEGCTWRRKLDPTQYTK